MQRMEAHHVLSTQLSQRYYELAPQVTQLEVDSHDPTGTAIFFENLWSSVSNPNAKTTLWLGGDSGAGKGTIIGQIVQLIEQAKDPTQEKFLPVDIPDNLQLQTTSLGQAIYYAHHVLQPGDTNYIASEPGKYTKDDYQAASRIITDWRKEFYAEHPNEPCLFLAEGPLFTYPELDQTWSSLKEAVGDSSENHQTFLIALVPDLKVTEATRRLRKAATNHEELRREADLQRVHFDRTPEELAVWRETRGNPKAVVKVRNIVDRLVEQNLSNISKYATTELQQVIERGLTHAELEQNEALRQAAVAAYYEWMAYDETNLNMPSGQVFVGTNTAQHPLAGYEPVSDIPYYDQAIQRHAHPYRRRQIPNR